MSTLVKAVTVHLMRYRQPTLLFTLLQCFNHDALIIRLQRNNVSVLHIFLLIFFVFVFLWCFCSCVHQRIHQRRRPISQTLWPHSPNCPPQTNTVPHQASTLRHRTLQRTSLRSTCSIIRSITDLPSSRYSLSSSTTSRAARDPPRCCCCYRCCSFSAVRIQIVVFFSL